MITTIERNGSTIYIHTAYATDTQGTDFALNYFSTATYIGTYMDRNSTENSIYQFYNWQLLEDPSAEAINDSVVITNNLEDRINNLEAANIESNSDIAIEARNTYEGIGNVNELIGTNQGANGYTAPSGFTIEALPVQIFEDPNIIQAARLTCNTASSGAKLSFDAAELLENIEVDNNTYTLSLMIRYSDVVELPVSIADSNGANALFDFGDIYIESVDPDDALEGEWLSYSATATMNSAVTVGNQNLIIDVGNMSAGDTIDIVNLKIEKGAIATPWRESLEEINQKAQNAYNKAENAETAAADAAKTATDYILPVDDGQGNITEVIVNTEKAESISDITKATARLTESSLDIYVDDESVASYGTSARIGTDRKIEISPESIQMFDGTNNIVFDVEASTITNVQKIDRAKTPTGSITSYIYKLAYTPSSGTQISMRLGYFYINGDSWDSYITATFTQGTSRTYSPNPIYSTNQSLELKMRIVYDGDSTFTITILNPTLSYFWYQFTYTAGEIQYPKYAIGLGLENEGTDTQIVLGQYNDSAQDQILTLGIGTGDTNRANLLEMYPSGTINMLLKGNLKADGITDNTLLDETTIGTWASILGRSHTPGADEFNWINDILNYLSTPTTPTPQLCQAKMSSSTRIAQTGATQITAIDQDLVSGSEITFNSSNKRFYIGSDVSVIRVSYFGTSTPTNTTQRWLRITVRKNGSNVLPYNQQYMTSGATATFSTNMLISVAQGDYIDFTTQTGAVNTVDMNSGFSFSVEKVV